MVLHKYITLSFKLRAVLRLIRSKSTYLRQMAKSMWPTAHCQLISRL